MLRYLFPALAALFVILAVICKRCSETGSKGKGNGNGYISKVVQLPNEIVYYEVRFNDPVTARARDAVTRKYRKSESSFELGDDVTVVGISTHAGSVVVDIKSMSHSYKRVATILAIASVFFTALSVYALIFLY